MDDRRRFFIILGSVSFGTVISLFLFMLRRGGSDKLTPTDMTSIGSNFAVCLAIVLVIGIYLQKRKKD